ncbi:MAG: hypothetical protein WC551_01475 [Patescibacteria group bacterium]
MKEYMRHALMRIYLNWQMFWRSLGKRILRFNGLDRRSKIMVAGACLAVVFLLAWGGTALAAPGDELAFVNIGGALGQMFLVILAGIVLLFMNLLMVIDLLLTKLLIAIAGYNNFVGAAAVATGWPLVRDVANMFFIVVLLIIAFSTIIGYKEMDYKKYVPRLLLMAVLINFSKTLVGLLIDFSQVIMLTFVNGFKEAAFGNFVKMFGLQNVLSIATTNAADAIATTSSLFIAAIFGVIMLSVVGTILLIMLIYFVARVIALWILLIFSPMAFFVWALPPKLQKSLSAFSNQWWQGLGSWLSGGPIVAFFLWLTMAIVAANDSPFADIMPNDSETGFLQAAITKAANPADIARFIVAVALLMMGLKQAVEVSKQASTALGNAAAKIKGAGGPIGYPARLGGQVAKKAGAAGVRAGAAGIKFADQKYGITKSLGQGMQSAGLKMGQGGGALGGALGSYMVKKGGGIAAVSTGRSMAAEKEHGEVLKNLAPKERQAYNEMQLGSINDDTARAARKAMLKDRFEPDFKVSKTKEYEDHFKGLGMGEQESKTAAAQFYHDETARMMEEQGKDKALMADSEHKKLISDKLKEDPSLQVNIEKLETEIGNRKAGEITPQSMQSLDTVAALLKSQGLIKNGALDSNIRGSKFYENMQKQGGNKFKQLEAGISYMEMNPGSVQPLGPDGKPISRGVRMVAGEKGVTVTARDSSGNYQPVNPAAAQRAGIQRTVDAAFGGASTAESQNFAGKLQAPLTSYQQDLVDSAASAGVYTNPSVGAIDNPTSRVMGGLQGSGVPSAAAFNYDQSTGAYAGPAYAGAHGNAVSSAMSGAVSSTPDEARENIQVISTIDTQVFATGGQAAEVVATSMQGKMSNIVSAINSGAASQEQVNGMTNVVKAAYQAGEAAINKEATGAALSAAEDAAKKLRAEIHGDKDLRNLATRK